MMSLKKYTTAIKGDSLINYQIPARMTEFKETANKAYLKLLADNNLDPSKYIPTLSKPGYINDDFIYNKFTVTITAVPINTELNKNDTSSIY